MAPDDVDAALRLCRLSHWNQVARDWRQFLRLSPGGATVAVDDAGVVIGSVATMRYAAAQPGSVTTTGRDSDVRLGRTTDARLDRHSEVRRDQDDVAVELARRTSAPVPGTRHHIPEIAWIAMVLVDPVHRGSGIGTALLEHGLASVADADAVGLDATPLGQPLYEKLAFRTTSTLLRMERPVADEASGSTSVAADGQQGTSLARVRPATAADLDAMAAIDGRASGLDRRAMIEWLRQGAPEFACVSTTDDALEGFVLGRHGHDFCHIGPVIAASAEAAGALVAACLQARPAHRFIVDIAESRPGWRARLETIGFSVQRPFARMYRGDWRPLEEPELIHASIGPEFG
jgi:GNAT superfamily N-acetyltransferase